MIYRGEEEQQTRFPVTEKKAGAAPVTPANGPLSQKQRNRLMSDRPWGSTTMDYHFVKINRF